MDTAYIKKYYLSTPNFQISNPNPEWKKKKGYRWDRGDCAIRALANAADVSWLEAFDYLIGHARAEYNVPNDKGGFRRYLCEGGGKWTAVKAEKRKKRMTVLDFAKSHPKGRYAVQIASRRMELRRKGSRRIHRHEGIFPRKQVRKVCNIKNCLYLCRTF